MSRINAFSKISQKHLEWKAASLQQDLTESVWKKPNKIQEKAASFVSILYVIVFVLL